MNPFDIFFVIVIGLAVAMGLWKGLARQVFALAGLIAGYFLALNFFSRLAPVFSMFDPAMAKIAAFMAIFVGILLLSSLLGFLLAKLVSVAGLGWLNRIGGAALGMVKGGLIVGIVALVLVVFLPPSSQLLESSGTLPLVLKGVTLAETTLPEDLGQKFRNRMKNLEQLRQRKEILDGGLKTAHGLVSETKVPLSTAQ